MCISVDKQMHAVYYVLILLHIHTVLYLQAYVCLYVQSIIIKQYLL